MITGDFAGTAQASARAKSSCEGAIARLPVRNWIGMDEATLRREIRSINIFARVVPEQKLRTNRGA